jgi:hypothetical protein
MKIDDRTRANLALSKFGQLCLPDGGEHAAGAGHIVGLNFYPSGVKMCEI